KLSFALELNANFPVINKRSCMTSVMAFFNEHNTQYKGFIMSDFRQPSFPGRENYGAASQEVVRNRVLRNTYWLLALSLIPTVIGAWVGVATGINSVMAASPGMSLILFFVGAFGLMYLVEKNKNSSAGVALLLAFTFFMGLM